jgi:hypothetical protein
MMLGAAYHGEGWGHASLCTIAGTFHRRKASYRRSHIYRNRLTRYDSWFSAQFDRLWAVLCSVRLVLCRSDGEECMGWRAWKWCCR